MSQIEQKFRDYLCLNPEIEHCYTLGLINRRSLARFLIQQGIGEKYQIEAIIAMIRRFDFKSIDIGKQDFSSIKINTKDNIIILDFVKEAKLVKELQNLVNLINYDKGDTLKIIIGNSSVKLFIDKENENICKNIIQEYTLNKKQEGISEISIIFNNEPKDTKGIVATLTKKFAVNDIVISEMLTSTPEILFYLEEKYIIKAYQILKQLKNSN